MPHTVIVLRRALTPAQARVLALMAEAPSYPKAAVALGVEPCTVRMHVVDIANLLPASFLPDAPPKDRVIVYAVRMWALAQLARAVTQAA